MEKAFFIAGEVLWQGDRSYFSRKLEKMWLKKSILSPQCPLLAAGGFLALAVLASPFEANANEKKNDAKPAENGKYTKMFNLEPVEKLPMENGDFLLIVRDALGNRLTGSSIKLTLPGMDGSLDNFINVELSIPTEGKDPQYDQKEDGQLKIPAGMMGTSVPDGGAYRLLVGKDGYVDWTSNAVWESTGPNVVETRLEPSLMIRSARPDIESGVSRLGVRIGKRRVEDGGAGDLDRKENGILFLPVSDADFKGLGKNEPGRLEIFLGETRTETVEVDPAGFRGSKQMEIALDGLDK